MRFRGTTEEGEVVEFKSYCKDSDHVIEYGSEIGIQKNIWKYVKKDSLICVEVESLQRQLAEARKVQNKLGEWVSHYIHCMRTVDYCGSLEDALGMEQYLYELKEKGENE